MVDEIGAGTQTSGVFRDSSVRAVRSVRVALAEEWSQLGARADSELAIAAVQVRFDRLDGKEQSGGDLFV